MILSSQSIRKLGMVDPFYERTELYGQTYGLGPAGYDIRIDNGVELLPGGFILASSFERFEMPKTVLGIVHDKSTWARRGLAVQNTVIEPGWCGYLTLELTNHGTKEIMVPGLSPICQIVFHLLDCPTDLPYQGKYQNQKRGPQGAR